MFVFNSLIDFMVSPRPFIWSVRILQVAYDIKTATKNEATELMPNVKALLNDDFEYKITKKHTITK